MRATENVHLWGLTLALRLSEGLGRTWLHATVLSPNWYHCSTCWGRYLESRATFLESPANFRISGA